MVDLSRQKIELINRINKKIEILVNEQANIVEEQLVIDALGADVAKLVSEKCRAMESSKFHSYVDDVGHITLLLLSLSGRLAKLINSLDFIATCSSSGNSTASSSSGAADEKVSFFLS